MTSVWLIQDVIAPYRVPLFAEIARSRDFNFTVVLTTPKCQARPDWNNAGQGMPFKVLTMWGTSIPLSFERTFPISFGLLPLLIKRKPDIVICCGFSLSTLMVFIYSKIFRKKYIVWSESTETTERIRGHEGKLRTLFRRMMAANAKAFIDAGKLSRTYIRSLNRSKDKISFFRSYNCVDSSLFSSCSDDGLEHNITRDLADRKILFVGRLSTRKGIPMLMDVYDEVLKKFRNNVDLILVGEGPLRKNVERFMRDTESARVKLCGQVAYSRVARYYRECDLFILLSLSDCNPLVIFEALHSGIPIICTDRAGNAPDFIVEGKNGHIVNPEDKDSIVQRVLEVLSWDSVKRREAAEISKQLVRKANYQDSAKAFIDACRYAMHK